ncbi:MAG: solute-binding protein, partial [Anaerolineae bacterium]|nr:solute-binding protein [Anaerolineae bacterium]
MIRSKPLYNILLLITILGLTTMACGLSTSTGPPRNAVLIEVAANTSLTPWLRSAIDDFNEAKIETAAGKPVFVNLNPVEAGQAVTDMTTGAYLPALWIPDSEVWVNVLAERGQTSFQGNCVSVAESPLVIAMWQPIAESLGWPGRSLGWLDIGGLAADPSAWAYYSGGQFGPTLRMGHTHPGLSGTGTSTLLAVVQAAQSKSDAVTVEEIQQPIVQASVSAFEGTVSWFSTSTDQLGQTMRERGIGYLGAAVMYESTVVNYGGGDPGIVPIYPFEGTFVATHPACVNGSANAETQEAAALFRDYLLGQEAQQLAVANGLRPVNDSVIVGAP